MDEVAHFFLYSWSILLPRDHILHLQTVLKYFLRYVINTDIVHFFFLQYQSPSSRFCMLYSTISIIKLKWEKNIYIVDHCKQFGFLLCFCSPFLPDHYTHIVISKEFVPFPFSFQMKDTTRLFNFKQPRIRPTITDSLTCLYYKTTAKKY